VPAGKRLLSLGIELTPNIPSSNIRPIGNIFSTGVQNGKEFAEGRLSGRLSYTDIVYPLASVLSAPVITTPAGNGTFTVTLGTPSAGTFTLTFNGQTTAGIAYNAAASAVATALAGLSTIAAAANISVTGSAGGPYTVTFANALLYTPLALTGSGAGLTDGTFSVTGTAASATRRWTFRPGQSAPNTCQSYTIEKGSASGASRVAYAMVTALEMAFTEVTAEVTGSLIAQQFADGISLTGGPTDITNQPVNAPEASAYFGNTLLGMTKFTRLQECKWMVNDRHVPVWSVDRAQTSYAATVEKAADMGAEIVVMGNSDADAYLADLKNGQAKFFRIQCVGPTIETGYPFLVEITIPARLKNPSRADRNDVFTHGYSLEGVYDSTFGTAVQVVVQNALTAL
jgi:hypothetical protein